MNKFHYLCAIGIDFIKKMGTDINRLKVVCNRKEENKQDSDAANNPKNAINTIFRQAKRHYDKNKHNVDADLIKSEYKLKV